MIARRLTIRIAWLLALFALSFESPAGEITHESFYSKTLGRDYAYTIYLPDGYEDSELRYPVLYLLHGSNGSENDWPERGRVKQTADRLIRDGAIPPTVIVMPGSLSWWVDGKNEKAETAFVDDLIPHIQADWRVVASRDGRLVGGLSAGGYGAINFILKFPQLFAAGFAMSPAVYAGYPPDGSTAWTHPAFVGRDGEFDRAEWDKHKYVNYLDAYENQDSVVPVFICSGDHDSLDIAYHSAVLYQALREHQPQRVEFRVVDGDHDWQVWADTLPEALTYVYRFASRPVQPPPGLD